MIYEVNKDELREITEAVDLPEAKSMLFNYFDLDHDDQASEEKLGKILSEVMEWKTREIEQLLGVLKINFGIVVLLHQTIDPDYYSKQHVRLIRLRHGSLIKNHGDVPSLVLSDADDEKRLMLRRYYDLVPDDDQSLDAELSGKLVNLINLAKLGSVPAKMVLKVLNMSLDEVITIHQSISIK